MLCYLLHSFICSFIVPSYTPCRITVTDEYTNTDMHAWHENKQKLIEQTQVELRIAILMFYH